MIRIEAAQLIDGVGELPRRPGRLAIAGDRLAAVSEEASQGPDKPVTIALPGCTLLPGLIDFHSHLGIDTRQGHVGLRAQVEVPPAEYTARGIALLQEDLEAGATTVRLCGDRYGVDLALRREIDRGQLVGPRLVAAGRAIRSPRSSGGAVASVLTEDPAEIDRAVQENLHAGVDFIKIFVSDGVGDPAVEPTTCYYGEGQVATAVRRAHDAGRHVAAHLLGGPGVAAAIGAGLNVIEHGWFLSPRDLDLVARYDVLLTLTTAVLCGPPGTGFGRAAALDARLQRLATQAQETARQVIARRGRYVVGTDALHGALAEELAWLVTLGETPARAIRAATVWPASALGLSDTVGTLEPGKVADVIAVEGDPLREMTAMTRVRLVVSRGRIAYLKHSGERG